MMLYIVMIETLQVDKLIQQQRDLIMLHMKEYIQINNQHITVQI